MRPSAWSASSPAPSAGLERPTRSNCVDSAACLRGHPRRGGQSRVARRSRADRAVAARRSPRSEGVGREVPLPALRRARLVKIASHVLPDRRLFLPARPASWPARDVAALGQVVHPEPVVRAMVALSQRGPRARALVRRRRLPCHLPASGRSELDLDHCPPGACRRSTSFAYPRARALRTPSSATPPYVRIQTSPRARGRIDRARRLRELLDGRANPTCSFIAGACATLRPGGELIHHPARLPGRPPWR